jgi:predicted Rossmann-fold nucleotide-binding protein
MGSSRAPASERETKRLTRLAERLGEVVAARGCVLVTGATTGFPDIASRATRRLGGLTIGISPAGSREEHRSRYSLPDDGVDVIVQVLWGEAGV